MKTTIIIVFLFMVSTFSTSVKKIEMNYAVAISLADVIVEGEISKISDTYYEFTVKEWLKGKSSEKITVTIWKEWTCDERIEKHKIGQNLLLILKKSKGIGYDIINDSTGELFIQPDKSVKTFRNPTLSTNSNHLKNGIKLFLASYQFVEKPNSNFSNDPEGYFNKLLKNTEIEKYTKECHFFKWLVSNLNDYEIK